MSKRPRELVNLFFPTSRLRSGRPWRVMEKEGTGLGLPVTNRSPRMIFIYTEVSFLPYFLYSRPDAGMSTKTFFPGAEKPSEPSVLDRRKGASGPSVWEWRDLGSHCGPSIKVGSHQPLLFHVRPHSIKHFLFLLQHPSSQQVEGERFP